MDASSPRRWPAVVRSLATPRRRHPGALLALVSLAAGAAAAAGEPVPAVWKEYSVSFSYSSARHVFSCDALRIRVAHVLLAVGARHDLKIKVHDCDTNRVPTEPPTFGRDDLPWGSASVSSTRFRSADRPFPPTIRARLRLPVEITPGVQTELKSDKSRRELISRVTGNPIPRFDDPIPFAAERRVVTLSRQTVGLNPEDCELLDQMVTGVFRQLDLRNVRRNYLCDRDGDSRIPPLVEVEALLAATPEPQAEAPTPSAGEEESQIGEPATSDEAP